MDTEPSDLASVKHVTPTYAQVHASAVFDKRLTNTQFRILSVLSLYANTEDMCWPKLDTLVDLLGTHKSAISRTINQLVDLGYVTIEKRGFPARNLYRVNRKAAQHRVDVASTLDAISDIRVDATATKSLRHGNSRVDATSTDMNRPIEQTKKNTRVANIDLSSSSLARSADTTAPRATAPGARERGFDESSLRRDPLTVGLIACLGYAPVTRREWGQWRIAVNDLHACGATADDIPRAIRGYQATYPRARVTPLALVGHWAEIQEGKPHDLAQLEISRRAGETDARQKAERQHADAERKAQEQREVQRLLGEYGY